MLEERKPAQKFELLQADDYSQYLVRQPREIAFLLRQLIAQRANITAYFDKGADFFLTGLLSIADDDSSIFLDIANNGAHNTKALNSTSLLCITQLERVKVQFSLERPVMAARQDLRAFQCPLPQLVLRLQRREYYRLSAPSSHSLICRIPDSGSSVEARVIDISGGGLAVLSPPGEIVFQPEMEFQACRFELPDFGPIVANLRVRNLFRISQRHGQDVLRAGCQFLNLSAPMANAIQRYVLRMERESQEGDKGSASQD